jgi:hypothetical protein
MSVAVLTRGYSNARDGKLRVLWDSQDWNLPFSYRKFTPPVVANGKLYAPTYNARVDLYGLA